MQMKFNDNDEDPKRRNWLNLFSMSSIVWANTVLKQMVKQNRVQWRRTDDSVEDRAKAHFHHKDWYEWVRSKQENTTNCPTTFQKTFHRKLDYAFWQIFPTRWISFEKTIWHLPSSKLWQWVGEWTTRLAHDEKRSRTYASAQHAYNSDRPAITGYCGR